MSEKRLPARELAKFFRVPVALTVDFDGRGLMMAARITNISKTGLFIATRAPLPVGKQAEFRFQLPGLRELVCVKGLVRWSRGSPAKDRPVAGTSIGMGVEFTEVSKQHQKSIGKFIEAFIAEMRRG